jgi:PAS domain S-box-containing protein
LAAVVMLIISDTLAVVLAGGSFEVLNRNFLGQVIFVVLTSVVIYLIMKRYQAATRVMLEESAATAQAIYESAAQGIVVIDQDGRIVSANPQLESLFGYSRAELIGQSLEMLLPERLRSRHAAHRDEYFKAPRGRPMGLGLDLLGQRKDGTEIALEVSLSSVELPIGRLAMAFITDITERLKLEHESRRSEKLVTLGAISAGIAHELNNPIGIICSRIELMLADAESRKLPAEVEEDLHVLYRNALRVSKTAQGLLTLARHRPKQRLPVDINAEVEEALLLVGKQMTKDGVHVTTVLDRTLPAIIGDSVALQEVLLNLIMNAREAISGGGTLRIETDRVPDRSDWVRLTVADSGCGIAAEAMAKLFDPFYTNKPNGTGLGLWVSKRIVRDHRGTIDVQSEPGKGTTFTVSLPSINADESAGQGTSEALAPSSADPRQRQA